MPLGASGRAQKGSEGGMDDAVGSPRRARISRLGLFELIILLKLDKRFSIEQFEAIASQSTVPSPPLTPSSQSKIRVFSDPTLGKS